MAQVQVVVRFNSDPDPGSNDALDFDILASDTFATYGHLGVDDDEKYGDSSNINTDKCNKKDFDSFTPVSLHCVKNGGIGLTRRLTFATKGSAKSFL